MTSRAMVGLKVAFAAASLLIAIWGLVRIDAAQYLLATTLHSWSKPYFNASKYADAPNCDGNSPCSSGVMKVMSFNVLCRFCDTGHFDGFETRLPHLVAMIRRHDPDLLGLQELSGQADLNAFLAAFPGYAAVSYRFGKWTDADSALLYRKDQFEALDSGQMWLTPKPAVPFAAAWQPASFPRYVNWVYLRRKSNGFRFLYLNTHFDNHKVNKETSAAVLSRALDRLGGRVPVVVTGDFNIDKSSPWFTRLTRDHTGRKILHDTASLAETTAVVDNAPEALRPRGKEFYTDPAKAIDHILLAGPERMDVYRWLEDVSVYGPDGHRPSDHPSVFSEFDLTLIN